MRVTGGRWSAGRKSRGSSDELLIDLAMIFRAIITGFDSKYRAIARAVNQPDVRDRDPAVSRSGSL